MLISKIKKIFFGKALVSLLLLLTAISCATPQKKELTAQSSTEKKALILYYTLYGSTKDVSNWVAEGMGIPTDIIPIKDYEKADLSQYDIIILGSAVYMENVALPMRDFLKEHHGIFKNKNVAIFVVSGSYLISGKRYLGLFEKYLGEKPLTTAYFGGRMVPDKLSKFHYSIMLKYWKDRGQEVQFFDFTDRGEANEFGNGIMAILSKKDLINE